MLHALVCAPFQKHQTGFRSILGSTFGARTYQAALREGLFRKPCRRSWALIPLPECRGVLTDQKFPRRLRWWRRFNDRKVEKGKGTRKRKKRQTCMHMVRSQHGEGSEGTPKDKKGFSLEGCFLLYFYTFEFMRQWTRFLFAFFDEMKQLFKHNLNFISNEYK